MTRKRRKKEKGRHDYFTHQIIEHNNTTSNEITASPYHVSNPNNDGNRRATRPAQETLRLFNINEE